MSGDVDVTILKIENADLRDQVESVLSHLRESQRAAAERYRELMSLRYQMRVLEAENAALRAGKS